MFVSYFPGWKRSDRLHLCSQIKKWGLSGFVFRAPRTFQLPPPKHHFFSGSFLLLFFPLLFLPCTISSSHTLFLSVPVPPLLLFFPLLLAVYDRREHTVHTHTQLGLYAYGAICAHRWYFAPWWQQFQACSLELLRTIQAVKSMGKKIARQWWLFTIVL